MTAGVTGFENQHPNMNDEEHPFKRPKLHLFKKDASRRIKTSSATRNLQPIYPLESLIAGAAGGAPSPFQSNKQANFNSINVGGDKTALSSGMPLGPLQISPRQESSYYSDYGRASSVFIQSNATNKISPMTNEP
jgi:hypothetical protein